MKITKSFCARCGKIFDFDLFSGLCPHCGCFHRSPGVTNNNIKTIVMPERGTAEANMRRHLKEDASKGITHNQHKTTATPQVRTATNNNQKKSASATTQSRTVYTNTQNKQSTSTGSYNSHKKSSTRLGRSVLVIVIIMMFSSYIVPLFTYFGGSSFSFNDFCDKIVDELDISEFMDALGLKGDANSDNDTSALSEDTDLYAETFEDIYSDNYYYSVYYGYKLLDSEGVSEITEDFMLPNGKMLIAVDMFMYYEGEPVTNPDDFVSPLVYADGEYCSCLLPSDINEITDNLDISDASLDLNKIYNNPTQTYSNCSGYLYYIVDEGCEDVLVTLPLNYENDEWTYCYVNLELQD